MGIAIWPLDRVREKGDSMTGCPKRSLLRSAFEQTSSRSGDKEIFEHVDHCPDCQAALEEWTANTEMPFLAVLKNSSLRQQHGNRNEVPASIPQQIGRFETQREIGRGGMGIVYQAMDPLVRRNVAIKVIRSGESATVEERRRIVGEAETVGRLHHPNIVQVYEVNEHEGCPFLVLEFVEGISLAERLKSGPMVPEEAAALIEKIADAVSVPHAHKIIHRDLKPGNILLSLSGEVKVTDFGLARMEDRQRNTQTGTVLGTPNYMSPEQASGKHEIVGPTSDIFSLGAILYECLTGVPPFVAATPLEVVRLVSEADVIPPRSKRLSVSWDLNNICIKCLERNPSDRYSTAADLTEDLRRYLKGLPVRARPIGMMQRSFRWFRREPMLASVITGLLLLALASSLTFYFLWQDSARNRDAAVHRQNVAMETLDLFIQSAKERLSVAVPMSKAEKANLLQSLALYAKLLEDQPSDEQSRYRLALAHRDVTGIYYQMEELTKAEVQNQATIGLLKALEKGVPNDPRYGLDLSRSYLMGGNISSKLKKMQAMKQFVQQSVLEAEAVIAKFGLNDEREGALACHQATLANVLLAFNELKEVPEILAKARVSEERLVAKYPDNSQRYVRLSSVLRTQGRHAVSLGDIALGIDAYENAYVLADRLVERFPNDPFLASEMVDPAYLAYLYRRQGKAEKSIEVFTNRLPLLRKLHERFPNVRANLAITIKANEELGFLHWNLEKGQSRSYFEAALAGYRHFVTADALEPAIATEYCHLLADCPDLTLRDIPLAHRWLSLVRECFPEYPNAEHLTALVLFRENKIPEARAELERRSANARNSDEDPWRTPVGVLILHHLGQRQAAEKHFTEANRFLKANPPHFSNDLMAWQEVGHVLKKNDK